MENSKISSPILQRLPIYLSYLRTLPKDFAATISATSIANALGYGDVQVRKDIASISSSGKPRVGYSVSELIFELESFLGYNKVSNAVIVGSGKLGTALLNYDGFKSFGMNILAAFDTDAALIGNTENGKNIFPLSDLGYFCNKLGVKVGILTVPAQHAQDVCDMMIKSGILAIMNFAPIHLRVPDGILIQNENIATSLALLARRLAEQLDSQN